jgi:hypothetical protein
VAHKFVGVLRNTIEENNITAERSLLNVEDTSGWSHHITQMRAEYNWYACSKGEWFLCSSNADLSQEKEEGECLIWSTPRYCFPFNTKAEWIQLFCEWKRHFISVVKPIPQEKVLLIIDGHSSHTLSLTAIEIARKHGAVISQHASNAASRYHGPPLT